MAGGTPLLCCCGTYAMRPLVWMAMCLFFLVAGWWAFGYAGVYSRYWRPSAAVTPLHWYHGVPGFLFTLTLVFTMGARLYRTRADGEDDDDDDNDGEGSMYYNYYYGEHSCMRIHRQTLQLLRIVAIVTLVVSGWATALMWATKDWFEPALDPVMGYALLLQAILSTLSLLCRWRQIVVTFQIVRDKRMGRYNPGDEEGAPSL